MAELDWERKEKEEARKEREKNQIQAQKIRSDGVIVKKENQN